MQYGDCEVKGLDKALDDINEVRVLKEGNSYTCYNRNDLNFLQRWGAKRLDEFLVEHVPNDRQIAGLRWTERNKVNNLFERLNTDLRILEATGVSGRSGKDVESSYIHNEENYVSNSALYQESNRMGDEGKDARVELLKQIPPKEMIQILKEQDGVNFKQVNEYFELLSSYNDQKEFCEALDRNSMATVYKDKYGKELTFDLDSYSAGLCFRSKRLEDVFKQEPLDIELAKRVVRAEGVMCDEVGEPALAHAIDLVNKIYSQGNLTSQQRLELVQQIPCRFLGRLLRENTTFDADQAYQYVDKVLKNSPNKNEDSLNFLNGLGKETAENLYRKMHNGQLPGQYREGDWLQWDLQGDLLPKPKPTKYNFEGLGFEDVKKLLTGQETDLHVYDQLFTYLYDHTQAGGKDRAQLLSLIPLKNMAELFNKKVSENNRNGVSKTDTVLSHRMREYGRGINRQQKESFCESLDRDAINAFYTSKYGGRIGLSAAEKLGNASSSTIVPYELN